MSPVVDADADHSIMSTERVLSEMADNKKGRDKQAHDREKRQRKREIAEELERMDELEPPVDPSELVLFETELDALSFPVTGATVVEELGEYELKTIVKPYTVEALIPDTSEEEFESPSAVRERVQRPTVAAALKRVVEASDDLQNTTISNSQHNAYEKTFRSLKAIDADDDDEGIQVISDWIVEQIREKERLPGSRAVRREAGRFCRENGYEIRTDDWLGI